jgi:amylosucrase
MPEIDIEYESQRSLKRIWPKILNRLDGSDPSRFSRSELVAMIEQRFSEHWLQLFTLLHKLYGNHYDFFYYLENITLTLIDCWLGRSDDLLELDIRRENDPGWYLSERMVGGSLYVDLFAGDLEELREKIPYFEDLGLTYLHLMPLLSARPGNSDGGYAVNDYRSVDPRLGTLEQLNELTRECRKAGISVVIDFVFNHTSDDHEWAMRAQEGEREFEDYYHIYPDRKIPDAYELNLREIFPTVRRGNFTYHEGMKQWVWTTFNSFQWDLKYSNPEVFRAMAAEMLFLGNSGVEILRLDAVAFIWKQMGTSCENLPEAHLLIQAFNTLCRIAAPSLVFKSEAIVHPDEVIKYIDRRECQMSYNPTLMALMWESVATRNVQLLKQSLSHRHETSQGTVWLNYLRSHDDIGWSFDNGDAWSVGIDPEGHRDFLNRFYTGRFPGSFASGVPFQHNEDTGDMRICGTMASLAGLEQALQQADSFLIDMALKRIRMMYGVISSVGGIPLLFLGEELGMLNDYSYLEYGDKEDDSRWVHRPRMDWDKLPHMIQNDAVRSINQSLKQVFALRRETGALRGNHMRLLEIGGGSVLAYLRWHDGSKLAVIANFSESAQDLDITSLKLEGMSHFLRDKWTDALIPTGEPLRLQPYGILWLVNE